MESDEWAVKDYVADDTALVCKLMRNMCQRLRICARIVCCIPLDHIIPSNIGLSKRNPNFKYSSSSTSLPENNHEPHKNNANGEPQDINKRIDSREKIFCPILLSSQRKLTFKEVPEVKICPMGQKKLTFESSANMLSHKKSLCGLLKNKISKKKSINARSDRESCVKRNKANGSIKSTEQSTKPKTIAKIAGWIDKKDHKKIKYFNKGRANKAVFSIRCTDNESSGDGPGTNNGSMSSSSLVSNRVIGYITHEVKKIKLVE